MATIHCDVRPTRVFLRHFDHTRSRLRLFLVKDRFAGLNIADHDVRKHQFVDCCVCSMPSSMMIARWSLWLFRVATILWHQWENYHSRRHLLVWHGLFTELGKSDFEPLFNKVHGSKLLYRVDSCITFATLSLWSMTTTKLWCLHLISFKRSNMRFWPMRWKNRPICLCSTKAKPRIDKNGRFLSDERFICYRSIIFCSSFFWSLK